MGCGREEEGGGRWAVRGEQGSKGNSPSFATLQAPGLPYSCGPYLGFLAVTLLLLRGGRGQRIRASLGPGVRAQVDGRGLGTRCSSVACAISGAEQAALARAREGERGLGGGQRVRECKGGGMAAVGTVVKSTWNR